MVRTLILVVAALLVAGCGGAVATSICPMPVDSGCAQPRGTYLISYLEEDGGTCGLIEERVIEVGAELPTMFDPPCSGMILRSADFCSGSFEATCPAGRFGPGAYNEQYSTSTWTTDGLRREGVYREVNFTAGGEVICESTYRVTAVSTSCR